MCVFNWRSLAPLFVAGLLSGFWRGNLLFVACPHCIPILDLYSVNSLILVKNGIDFLNMHIIYQSIFQQPAQALVLKVILCVTGSYQGGKQ